MATERASEPTGEIALVLSGGGAKAPPDRSDPTSTPAAIWDIIIELQYQT